MDGFSNIYQYLSWTKRSRVLVCRGKFIHRVKIWKRLKLIYEINETILHMLRGPRSIVMQQYYIILNDG